MEIRGPIGPATSDYIARAVDLAGDQNLECLVIELDTPGGLLDSTEKIVQSFYGSQVPVVVYVAPSGAKAGSAGCFITLAAHIAVMAPNTSIGAAHPVSAGGGEVGDVMKEKMASFASSYIQSIAEKRGRNAEWAITSVRDSASITSEKALELGVIDFLASNRADLLSQLDGRETEGHKLSTAESTWVEIPMLPRERVFQRLWRPEVLFVLMLVAVYGIIGELSNPGTFVPGVIGAIALVLALYMGSVIPVNLAGVALIVLALGLFIAEIFTPSFGFLTVSGSISFFIGALMLFNRADATFQLSLSWILPATLVTTLFAVVVLSMGLRAQFGKARVGVHLLVGQPAQVVQPVGPSGGQVFVQGETWRAISSHPVSLGKTVEITAVNGLTLTVREKSETALSS
jgi:membrane-bound serine protease (ClpP class)